MRTCIGLKKSTLLHIPISWFYDYFPPDTDLVSTLLNCVYPTQLKSVPVCT